MAVGGAIFALYTFHMAMGIAVRIGVLLLTALALVFVPVLFSLVGGPRAGIARRILPMPAATDAES